MEPPWQKGKEKAPRDQKGNGKTATSTILDPIPLGNQTARTHARTKRNDFQVEHPPTSDPTGFGLHIVSPDPSLAPRPLLN